jgi:hypothetical protein
MAAIVLRWVLTGLLASAGMAGAGAAFVPVNPDNREQVFEIPKGTWARRHAGANVEILPQRMELALGLRDVLLLRNLDDVPQIFGPTLIMPGQSFRLPFSSAGEFQFACTAHVSGQMTVAVAEGASAPWPRLRYRLAKLSTFVSRL